MWNSKCVQLQQGIEQEIQFMISQGINLRITHWVILIQLYS